MFISKKTLFATFLAVAVTNCSFAVILPIQTDIPRKARVKSSEKTVPSRLPMIGFMHFKNLGSFNSPKMNPNRIMNKFSNSDMFNKKNAAIITGGSFMVWALKKIITKGR
jgi:hypothetical protein